MHFVVLFSVTSRPPRELEENGKNYWFIEREEMEKQIRQHKFLEYGEHNGNLYGTSLDSIRNAINEGKMCVLDCSPPVSSEKHKSCLTSSHDYKQNFVSGIKNTS